MLARVIFPKLAKIGENRQKSAKIGKIRRKSLKNGENW
jgi:hypothetical protein